MKTEYIGVVLAGALAIAGCGGSGSVADKAAEKMIENQAHQEGKDVDVELNSEAGTFSVTSKEGNTQVNFGGGSLPEGWPDDVPVAEGLTVTMSQSNTADGQFVVTGSLKKGVTEVADYYKKSLTEKGWTEENVSSMNMQGMQMSSLQYTKEDRSVTVTVTQQDAETQLTIVVETN